MRITIRSWLMQLGIDMWEAAGYLGMSIKMLEEVYGHHHPEHQKSIRTAFKRTTPTRIRNVS